LNAALISGQKVNPGQSGARAEMIMDAEAS
jgi:hypothetical protein